MQGVEYPRHSRRKKSTGPATESGGGVDWSSIFDLVASEYGYTWEQFISLTYIQVNAFLESISKRRHNDTVINAQIHGLKMEAYRKKQVLSEAQFKNARELTAQLLKEKQNGR